LTATNPVTRPISIARLAAYAALQLPIGMAALPIVVNASYFYENSLNTNLAWLGAIFLFTRALDAIQDPIIGYYSDRLTHRKNGRLLMVMASVPLLAMGFYGVFAPPNLSGGALMIYLTGMLMLAHLGYSGVTISYHSLGAELSYDYNERTRVTVSREVFGIVGALLGLALPETLTKHDAVAGYATFGLIYLPVLIIPAVIVWLFSPRAVTPPVIDRSGFHWRSFVGPLFNARFRLLLLIYLVNGTAVAIAASVVLFFVTDVIHAKDYVGLFVITYFGSGALSVPFWLWLSRRSSKSVAWIVGVVMSSIGLLCACLVGTGDVVPFFFISALAGCGLGADYGLPPSILADIIHNEKSESQGESGRYFGLWAMSTKLMTAIGAGVALPLLELMHYKSNTGGPTYPLIITYALLPAAVKIGAAIMLWLIQVEANRPSVREQLGGGAKVLKPSGH